jgi:hypothetical protein
MTLEKRQHHTGKEKEPRLILSPSKSWEFLRPTPTTCLPMVLILKMRTGSRIHGEVKHLEWPWEIRKQKLLCNSERN